MFPLKLKKFGLSLFLIFAMLVSTIQASMAFDGKHHHGTNININILANKHKSHKTIEDNSQKSHKQSSSQNTIKSNSCCMTGCLQTGILNSYIAVPRLNFQHYNDISVIALADERPIPHPRPPSILL